MTTKKTQKAPVEPNKTKSTQSNTKVAQKAKSSQNAIQSVTEGVKKSSNAPKPTIKSLQTALEASKLIVSDQEVAILHLQSRIFKLEDAYADLEQALEEEINRSWWDITKERVKETYYILLNKVGL